MRKEHINRTEMTDTAVFVYIKDDKMEMEMNC